MAPGQGEERRRHRVELNGKILARNHKGTKRFFAIDADAYRPGVLPAKEKELMGLVGSMVLRCNDCILYHLDQCVAAGARMAEIEEAMHIALVIGGSIVIPHLRYAYQMLEELAPPE